MTLYRKYRPQKLSEIIGQERIVEALTKQLEKGKTHHAYLFTGPKGTGKTSTARILAKALNCTSSAKSVEPCNKCKNCLAITSGTYLDLIEIDAASNRGIDDIRQLREGIKLAPAGGKYKVYIIDEAHMLTPEAFNALLKTLEEPPEHAVFILATTEPHKLPGTIISRSQRFDFERPSVDKIQKKLKIVVKEENWKLDDDALAEIAKVSDGAFRDAEVLLEKVGSVNPKAKKEEILELIGKKKVSQVLEILKMVEAKDTKEAIIWLDDFISGGGNIRVLNEAILETLRKFLLIKTGVGEKLIRDVTPEEFEELNNIASMITQDRLTKLINLFSRSIQELAMATIPQLPLELALVEACDFEVKSENDSDKAIETELDQKEKPDTKIEKENKASGNGKTKSKEDISEEKILKKIKIAWPNILKEVRSKNKSLEMFMKAAIPESFEDETLNLKFYYQFHKDRVEDNKNRTMIESVIEREVASPVKIRGIMGGKPPEKAKPKELVQESQKNEDPSQIFGGFD